MERRFRGLNSKDDEPSENLTEYLQRVRAIEEQLTDGLPEDKDARTKTQKATGLLADLLEWHRREDKSKYWEYFTRCDYSDEEFITDRATLGGLVYLFGRFPRLEPAALTPEGTTDHGPLDRHSEQGRTRQSQEAA